jgi:hypothetical protein
MSIAEAQNGPSVVAANPIAIETAVATRTGAVNRVAK